MRLFEGTQYDRPPTCDRCGELETDCQCEPLPPPLTPPAKQTARLRVEKRRKGKVVTVIRGLAADDNDLPALLAKLKSSCGAGGALKDDEVEVQGSHLDRVAAQLEQLGYRVKR